MRTLTRSTFNLLQINLPGFFLSSSNGGFKHTKWEWPEFNQRIKGRKMCTRSYLGLRPGGICRTIVSETQNDCDDPVKRSEPEQNSAAVLLLENLSRLRPALIGRTCVAWEQMPSGSTVKSDTQQWTEKKMMEMIDCAEGQIIAQTPGISSISADPAFVRRRL